MALMGALLLAALPAAYGQNATPAGQQSANPSSPAPASGGPSTGTQQGAAAEAQGTAGASGAQQATAEASQAGSAQQAGSAAGGTPQANGAAKSGKSPPVCFKLTGHCVDLKKTPADKGTAKDAAATKQPLNLTAPDVRTVVSEDELKEPLPSTEQITEVQEDQTVSVKGEGVPADVPGGFGALWWAMNHPSQAWKILTPVE